MGETANSTGVISESDLAFLTALYREFEGAPHPLAKKAKEAEFHFNSNVYMLYEEKVKPRFSSISFPAFKSYARNICRKRVASENPDFLCP